MSADLVILTLVVITALGFDFTNGFHDTGNAMATSIATGALKPKVAVLVSAILNLVGAFLSVEVAATITKDVLKIQSATGALTAGLTGADAMTIIFAGLIGGILWNLFTWLLGLPSSSSHALFGGLIGAGLAALGTGGVNWNGIVGKVLVPAVLSPFIAGLIAAIGTFVVYAVSKRVRPRRREQGFRWGQVGTASLVSLAHGTGDAQKTMGVIALALIAHGSLTADSVKNDGLPVWIILTCALAIALGTYLGGWRIIRTLGKGLVEIESPQGMAAEASSAAIILTSSHLGMALSTTHVATGSILGSGVGKPGATVRWGVAGRMVLAWLTTLPAAGVVGAACYAVAHLIGGLPGALTIFAILVALASWMYLRSRAQKVDHTNVNHAWDEQTHSPTPADRVSEPVA
ncbi:inorganic phosphate transporter [Calidifontibacter sp. DB0510]|uniref:Phosphate transporter n=1 Tax=Metallococcus carri TaxID=1656884 RepID=A0A967B210_9MICO|nr:inorganic phosphate transporter [Metallococcus carri]NHN56068.1 inorganic phosphate transporter [Metallococcus carri]NOP37475.1 inorganic phosphate transporter [Calidifontibacter sp. DB2511S]